MSASITNDENVTSSLNTGDDLCQLYNQVDSCPSNYECKINTTDNSPYCSALTSADYYSLLLGLAIGLPVFFLFLGIGLLLSVYCRHQRHTQKHSKDKDRDLDRSSHPDAQIFASNMPHRYRSFGRKSDQMFHSYWDNGGFESYGDYGGAFYQAKDLPANGHNSDINTHIPTAKLFKSHA